MRRQVVDRLVQSRTLDPTRNHRITMSVVTALALLATVMSAGAPHAAEAELESRDATSPAFRKGPIWDGRQHQPSVEEIIERERAQGKRPGLSTETTPEADELYRRILKQSDEALPPSLEPPK
jgi:hypothetical protein